MQSALFLGRFQPFHKGHLYVIKEILKKNDRVIIAIGSAENNYLPANPFTAAERFEMIDAAMKEAKIPAEKYCIIPIRNINNYQLWVNHVNSYVPHYTRVYTGSKLVRACYEGKYSKPSEKNKVGPEIVQLKRHLNISATKVRDTITANKNWETLVPKAVAKIIKTLDGPKRLKTIKNTIDVVKFAGSY